MLSLTLPHINRVQQTLAATRRHRPWGHTGVGPHSHATHASSAASVAVHACMKSQHTLGGLLLLCPPTHTHHTRLQPTEAQGLTSMCSP